jgi:hypothetical protein
VNVESKPYLTVAEYLAIERQSETRSEYLDGVAGLDSRVALPSIGCELSLVEVYGKVELG